MDAARLLNLLATIFGAWGGLHVLQAVARLSPEDLGRLAQTGYGFSVHHAKALAEEWADAMIGMALIVIAFLLAFVTLAFIPEGRWGLEQWTAWSVVGVTVVGTYAIQRAVGPYLRNRRIRAIGKWFVGFYVERYTRPGKELESAFGTISVCGREFLGLEQSPGESERDFVGRVVVASGLTASPETESRTG